MSTRPNGRLVGAIRIGLRMSGVRLHTDRVLEIADVLERAVAAVIAFGYPEERALAAARGLVMKPACAAYWYSDDPADEYHVLAGVFWGARSPSRRDGRSFQIVKGGAS